MYIYTNERKLKKNKKLSKSLTIASFMILIAGAVAAFYEKYIGLSFICLIVGFITSQISIAITSKWGREPSNNNIFNVKLKGLSDNFSLYHWLTPVDHLLVGTAGAFILLPYFQGGEIGYDEKKGRWTQKKGNLLMKLFGQESIGRPDQDCETSIEEVRKYFISQEIDFPEDKIHPLLVFINPQTKLLEDQNFKYDTIPLNKLKETIREYAKADRIDPEFIDQVTDKLPLDDLE